MTEKCKGKDPEAKTFILETPTHILDIPTEEGEIHRRRSKVC